MYKLLDAAQAITLAAGCHAKCSSFDVKSYIPPLGSKPGLSPAIHWHKSLWFNTFCYKQNLPQRGTGMHTKLQTYFKTLETYHAFSHNSYHHIIIIWNWMDMVSSNLWGNCTYVSSTLLCAYKGFWYVEINTYLIDFHDVHGQD